MRYAWPFEVKKGSDDMFCDDRSGFAIGRSTGYNSILDLYKRNLKKKGDDFEDLVSEGDPLPGFYIVADETHTAASVIPFGEYDSETMCFTRLRKTILRKCAQRVVLPK